MHIEPVRVFHFFEEISAIPRPSGKEDAIADYLVRFAQERDLECHRDAANNVVIIQEASDGRESDEPIVIQGHMDMVCEKESSCKKDMDVEGLDLRLDGDWLFAEGTTLGGDDGIAVAIALALMDDPTLSHPRLEFLCTTEEETGMGGAHAFEPEHLRGRILLNIDSEEEGVLTVGCAGGETIVMTLPVARDSADVRLTPIRLRVSGLTGGHSGIEIDRGRANADLLLARALRAILLPFADHAGKEDAECPCRILSLRGGAKINAIPREAETLLLVLDPEGFSSRIAELEEKMRAEYAVSDPELRLIVDEPENELLSSFAGPLTNESAMRCVSLLSAMPNGVQRMDQHLAGLVETSLNLGVLDTANGEIRTEYLLRSSIESALDELVERLLWIAGQHGAVVQRSDRYPAWEFMPESPFRDRMVQIFREQYGYEPKVETVHAGLECGILSKKMPGLEAVSIGPDLRDIHTPQEKMSVSSVGRTYAYVRAIIEK